MRDEKGITMLILVITVILTLLIAVTATYSGIDTYKGMRVKTFSEQLKIVRERVAVVKDKASTNSEINLNSLGKSLDELDDTLKESVTNAINNSDELSVNSANYRYFDSKDLKDDLGIDIESFAVAIDFERTVVIGVYGIEYEGQGVYTQKQIDEINNN